MDSTLIYNALINIYAIAASLGYYILYINLFSVLVVGCVSTKISSPLITLAVLAFFNAFMTWATYEMKLLYDDELGLKVVRHLWYIVFAIFNLLIILSIKKLHTLIGIKSSKFTNTVVLVSICLGVLFIVKYMIRMHFNIDNESFRLLYLGLVNTANVLLACLSLVITFMSLKIKFDKVKGIK